MAKIVISSGHGKYVRGASGYLDEVDEARRVVTVVADYLREAGHQVETFHDNTSVTQSENLDTIVDYHNSQTRDLDVSVHFNAYIMTPEPMGCEVLYLTQASLAEQVSAAIAAAGHFIDRGPKKRTDLAFLNGTEEPAILIETCFVDSASDAKNYNTHFDAICMAIASVGEERPPEVEQPAPPAGGEAAARFAGKCSWFGGPDDEGVSPSEGLAFLYEYDDAPHLFLDEQPAGTTGLARRLNPDTFYVACRWDYDETPKEMLAQRGYLAAVSAGGKTALAWPADWGPHGDTDRAADLSPGLMEALGLGTDDEVEVTYPVLLPR